MKFPYWTATAVVDAIRLGHMTAVEALQSCLAHVRRVNPLVRALVDIRGDQAMASARAADLARRQGRPLGPLHGLPMTVKDACRVAGFRSTYGFPLLKFAVAARDSQIVARLKAAGAVLFARSNVPTFSFDWQSQNLLYGRTNNPWNLERTAGGSSGGAAAAVAAGMTPLELGSDVAGSIRCPAHFCGVYGLRTTRGLWPADDLGLELRPARFTKMLALGPLARSIDDLILLFEVCQGSPPAPAPRVPPRLRLAWADQIGDLPASPDTRALLRQFMTSLAADGHQVTPASPAIDWIRLYRLSTRILGYDIKCHLPWPLPHSPFLRRLLQEWLIHYRLGHGTFAQGFWEGLCLPGPSSFRSSLEEQAEYVQIMDRFFSQVDLWITPTVPFEAFPHQRSGADFNFRGLRGRYTDVLGAYLCPTALTDHPILNIPVGFSSDGMPIGLQVHGPRGSDRLLLEMARQQLSRHAQDWSRPQLLPPKGCPAC